MSLAIGDTEVQVLRALADGAWRTPTEVLGPLRDQDECWCNRNSGYVRELLKALAGRHLVERGVKRWGEWRITERGRDALAGRDQMRLA